MNRNAAARVAEPKHRPRTRHAVTSYDRAIARAVKRANWSLVEAGVEPEFHVPHWHPNQLRHARATDVRKCCGLEAAQVVLGHERADVTQTYAERDRPLAVKVAKEIG